MGLLRSGDGDRRGIMYVQRVGARWCCGAFGCAGYKHDALARSAGSSCVAGPLCVCVVLTLAMIWKGTFFHNNIWMDVWDITAVALLVLIEVCILEELDARLLLNPVSPRNSGTRGQIGFPAWAWARPWSLGSGCA